MRAFERNQEREYDRTRLILFEMINGNPNIKKSSKPRRPSDIFPLSIDVKVEVKAVKISSEVEERLKEQGYTVPKCFIDGK